MGAVLRGGRPAVADRRPFALLGALILVALLLLRVAPALASDAGGHVPSAEDRYSLANGCFALRSAQTGGFVAKSGGGYAATAASAAAAEPFRMQATDLGSYLFYGPAPDFLARAGSGAAASATSPSNASDWTVSEDAGGFRIQLAAHDLVVGGGDSLVTVPKGSGGAAGVFLFEPASGCADYPEIEVNVEGPLPQGGSPGEAVRGLVETHMHQMAYEFLSTKAHCGKPWHRFGAPFALQDCPDHAATGGCTAIIEVAFSGSTCHDPGGWPSFSGWPDYRQVTHEQSYYKWIERSWRAGMRIFVNLAVENRVLCELYDLYVPAGLPSPHGCNEMVTIRRELQRMRELERYIDAQNGGPGEGWYRIVGSPEEARQVIADGKLAVIPGMETSEPFGCRIMQPGDMPLCSEQQVRDGLDEIYELGVRQLELVNKSDNALSGIAGDSGNTGFLTNLANFYSAGTFWDLEGCEGIENPELNHDHSPTALSHNDDQLAANVLDALGDTTGITFPVYGSPPHCNQRGLTALGEVAIRHLMGKGMIFDPDHMSVIARNRALDIVEAEQYPGVMTSHSWSTDNALPRISRLGGLIGPAAKSPAAFVADWAHIKLHGYDQENPHLFGFGYGADMNGFATQGEPLPAGSQISYPFTSPIDPAVTVHKQESGTKTFDINVHGTAHYGLYADWAEAVRVAGGDEIVDDLANGAEAYLQMWERAVAAANGSGPGVDSGGGSGDGGSATGGGSDGACAKWPRRIRRAGLGKRLRLGDGEAAVLAKAGAPSERDGDAWTWCARGKRGKAQRVIAVFDESGALSLIARTGKSRAAKIARGTAVARLRGLAESLGGGIWARPAGANTFVYRVRRGKVAFAGVAAGEPTLAELRSALRLAGLR